MSDDQFRFLLAGLTAITVLTAAVWFLTRYGEGTSRR